MTLPAAARQLADALDLVPHPEGGWYRETWRAAETVATAAGPRPAATSIHFLLGGDAVSRIHRLAQPELWCHQAGPGLALHLFDHGEDARPAARVHRLGPGRQLQAVVPARTWFGAEAPDSWALVACICAPGFMFADLTFASRSDLAEWWPDHGGVLARLLPRPTAGP